MMYEKGRKNFSPIRFISDFYSRSVLYMMIRSIANRQAQGEVHRRRLRGWRIYDKGNVSPRSGMPYARQRRYTVLRRMPARH